MIIYDPYIHKIELDNPGKPAYYYQIIDGVLHLRFMIAGDYTEFKDEAGLKPWRDRADTITKVVIDNYINFTHPDHLFTGMINLTMIDNFEYLFITGAESTANMFENCYRLTELDCSQLQMDNVTDASSMFLNTLSLHVIHLEQWNTSSLANINNMFENNRAEVLDLSSFDTSNLVSMKSAFANTNMLGAKHIINLGSWDTSKVTDMTNAFRQQENLEHIYVGSKWNTDQVTASNAMFLGCSKLPNYSSRATDKSRAYVGDNGYLELKDPIKNIYYTINDDNTEVEIAEHANVLINGEPQIWEQKATGNNSLAPWSSLLSGGTVNIIEDIAPYSLNGFFANAETISGLDKINDSDIIDAVSAFENFCGSDKILDLTNFTLSKCKNMDKMFKGIGTIGSILIDKFDTTATTSVTEMFANSTIKYIFVGDKWNLTNCSKSNDMFKNCTQLPNFDATKTNKTNAYQFDGINKGYLRKSYGIIQLAWGEYMVLRSHENYPDQKPDATHTFLTPPGPNEEWLHFDSNYSPCVVTNAKINLWTTGQVGTKLPPNISDILHLCNKTDSAADVVFNNCDFTDVIKANGVFKDFIKLTRVESFLGKGICNLQEVAELFSGCVSLTDIKINVWNPDTIQISNDMFKGCALLPNFAKHPDSLDKTYALFNTGFNDGRFKNTTPDSGTLYIAYADNYSKLFIAGAKITDDYEEFTTYQKSGQDYPIWNQHAAEIQSVDIISNATAPTAINLFSDLSNIVTIGDFANLSYDKNKVHSVMGMFQKCTKLEFDTLDFNKFETMGDIYHAGSMFASCKWVGPLLGIGSSGFGPLIYLDFNQCRNFSGMFAYSNFTEIKFVDSLNYLPVVTTMKSMFEGCGQLTLINTRSNWDFSQNPITTNMFTNCTKLHNWKAENPTDGTYAVLDNGYNGGYFTNY